MPFSFAHARTAAAVSLYSNRTRTNPFHVRNWSIDRSHCLPCRSPQKTCRRLLEYKAVAGIEKLPRGKLRRLMVAGAPLDVALKSRVETEFGLPLSNGYGITECAPAIAGARAEAPRSDDAVGSLITGIEARLVTPGGGAVAPGEVGELHVRGPNVMRGYYRNPEAPAAAIDVDGWFNTGDLARFEDEILYIVGRTKELIIRSGFNVYPAEVEAVLNEHPAVV